MTPNKYDVTLTRITEAVETLRQLDVPPEVVHSIDVQHWHEGSTVGIHVNGESDMHRELVDRIADHYDLPPDDGKTSNYTRGEHLGRTPIFVFCGRKES